MIILFSLAAVIAIPQLLRFSVGTGQTGDRDQKLVVVWRNKLHCSEISE